MHAGPEHVGEVQGVAGEQPCVHGGAHGAQQRVPAAELLGGQLGVGIHVCRLVHLEHDAVGVRLAAREPSERPRRCGPVAPR